MLILLRENLLILWHFMEGLEENVDGALVRSMCGAGKTQRVGKIWINKQVPKLLMIQQNDVGRNC